MRKVLAFALICFLGAISAGAAMAQDRPIDFSSKGANVFSAPGGQSLTLPSQAPPPAVVADFLRAQGRLEATVGSLAIFQRQLESLFNIGQRIVERRTLGCHAQHADYLGGNTPRCVVRVFE